MFASAPGWAQTGAGMPDHVGVVLVAHGADRAWNAPVHQLAARLRATLPVEVTFLMGEEGRDAREAYARLVQAGVRRVVVVPLLVSSHSAHAEQVRFIGGLRDDYPHADHMTLHQIKGDVPVVGVASALDDDPILGAILADRAQALSKDPASETLVLVAHGPNEDREASQWLDAMQSLARQIAACVPFRHVESRLLRDDAPAPVKDKALAELRASVEAHTQQGRVVVVPLLLGAGRVANQIPDLLKGLPVAWSGQPILPDDRIAEWVLAQVRAKVGAQGDRGASIPRRHEEVVVTATRTEQPESTVPVQTAVIGRDTIEATGARSLADVLSREVGIEVVPTLAGDGVQLQGIDSRGVLVLVDGQEVLGKVGGSIDIANLLVADIDRVEVVKGAASALYGSDALGGVINILTRRASQPLTFSAEQRFESLDGRTTLVSMGTRQGRWNLSGSASRVSRDSYDLTPEEPSTTGSAYTKRAVGGKVAYERGATEVSVATRYYGDEAADVTASRGVLFDDLVEDTRWQTVVEVRTRPAARDTLAVRGHLSRYEHSYDQRNRRTSTVTPDLTRERLGEIELQYDRTIGARHLVTGGAEYERIGMTSDRIEPHDRHLDSAVGFVQDQWFVHERVNVVAGLRYDRSVAFGSAWSPKAAMLVTPVEGVRLRVSYGEGFKAPAFKDLYYLYTNRTAGYRIVGNETLRSETSRSLSAGVDVDTLADRVSLGVTVFRHRIDDLIDYEFLGFDPSVGLTTLRTSNVGRAGTSGVDTNVTLRPSRRVSGSLGYSYLDARDLEADEPLTGRARHSVKARVRVDVGERGPRLSVFGRINGTRAFADADGDGHVEDYAPRLASWDVRVSQRIAQSLELIAGAENVGNARDVRYYPTAGRRAYVGLTMSVSR
ncbi:MAG: TonB-dependent receptor [Acidobacteria bacterium]|nr:TonB-dependent receptor [Acidobacteriota bacterium]